MDKIELPYVIRPVLHKNYIKRILFLVSMFSFFVFAAAFDSGSFDSGMFIFQVIMMSIVFYIVFRFSYRTIKVEESHFIYMGLTRKIQMKYVDINNAYILIKENDKNLSYSLIVSLESKKYDRQISNLEIFKRTEISKLIDLINSKSNQSNMDLKNELDKVEWRHD